MTIIEEFQRDYADYNDLSADRRWRQRKFIPELLERVSGPEAITAADLRAYLNGCVTSGLNPNSVRNRLGVISPFIHWLWQTKRITAEAYMELKDVKPPRGSTSQGTPKPYKRKQIDQFWADLGEQYPWAHDQDTRERGEYYLHRWRTGLSRWGRVQPYAKRVQIEAIVGLALYGGMRVDEMWRLEVEEMHHENEYVVASTKKNRRGVMIERPIPHTDQLRSVVKAWLDLRASLQPATERPWLSLHQHARLLPMQERTFKMLLRNVGRGWEFHRMRHTFATESLRAGMKLEVLSRILGHGRIQQTLVYAELVDTDLVRASRRVQSEFNKAVRPAA